MRRWTWFGGGETSLSRVGVCAFSKAACASSSSAEARTDVVRVAFVLVAVLFFVVGCRVGCQALGGGAFLEAGSMQLFGVLAAPSQRALRGICL